MPDFSSEQLPCVSAEIANEELENTERMMKNMNNQTYMQKSHHTFYPKTIAETDLFARYQ